MHPAGHNVYFIFKRWIEKLYFSKLKATWRKLAKQFLYWSLFILQAYYMSKTLTQRILISMLIICIFRKGVQILNLLHIEIVRTFCSTGVTLYILSQGANSITWGFLKCFQQQRFLIKKSFQILLFISCIFFYKVLHSI